MYEGVTRVPLVVVPPQRRITGDFGRPIPEESITVGHRCDELCSLLDIVPSVLDLAQIPQPNTMEGKSLLPWVRGQASGNVHETVFAEWHRPGVRMARSEEWKYVLYQDGAEELFHLAEDPSESKNLAGNPEYKAELEAFREELKEHIKRTGDPWEDLSKHAFLFTPEGYISPPY